MRKRMFNPLKKIKFWFYPVIFSCLLIHSVAFATEESSSEIDKIKPMVFAVTTPAIETKSTEEALSYANRLKAISNTIKENYQNLILESPSKSSINMFMTNKLKAIIAVIETQRKNLVDMVTNGSMTNTVDNKKLNSIVDALESQRASLSELIDPALFQKDNTDYTNTEKNINNTNKSFEVYKN